MFEYITRFLKMNDVEYKENANLSKLSIIRIGGNASIIAYPNSAVKYIELLRFLGKLKTNYIVIGRMTNILPSDSGYAGIIIKTDRLRSIFITDNTAYVSAGITNAVLAGELCRKGLSGFEELSGIPGSIGGAICGNAGAFGREISDIVSEVTFYSPDDDTVYTATSGELEFAYRNSAFKRGFGHIISAKFDLTKSDTASISKLMDRVREMRNSTQPLGELSLGSTFKRPSSGSAARMIDECCLKGYRIGGAEISDKHAGFIINKGDATAKDYLNLADYAREKVYQKFGVHLEREVEII